MTHISIATVPTFAPYLPVAKRIKTTSPLGNLSTFFHEHHVRRALQRRHRHCPTHGIRRTVCPTCIRTYCVLCTPTHIADHFTHVEGIRTETFAELNRNLLSPEIAGTGKPVAQARKSTGTKPPTHVVLPAAYNKLVAECTSQKVRILAFTEPNEITVALEQGELMDDLVHQLGYRVVSMTEFTREKRTVFILEKK